MILSTWTLTAGIKAFNRTHFQQGITLVRAIPRHFSCPRKWCYNYLMWGVTSSQCIRTLTWMDRTIHSIRDPEWACMGLFAESCSEKGWSGMRRSSIGDLKTIVQQGSLLVTYNRLQSRHCYLNPATVRWEVGFGFMYQNPLSYLALSTRVLWTLGGGWRKALCYLLIFAFPYRKQPPCGPKKIWNFTEIFPVKNNAVRSWKRQ